MSSAIFTMSLEIRLLNTNALVPDHHRAVFAGAVSQGFDDGLGLLT